MLKERVFRGKQLFAVTYKLRNPVSISCIELKREMEKFPEGLPVISSQYFYHYDAILLSCYWLFFAA